MVDLALDSWDIQSTEDFILLIHSTFLKFNLNCDLKIFVYIMSNVYYLVHFA